MKRKCRVRILDDFSNGKLENLEEALGMTLPPLDRSEESSRVFPISPHAELIVGDISDFPTCRAACQGISSIYHQAALGSVPRSVEDPLTFHRVNATGTLHILQAAREAKVKRVVYASSSSVYGNLSSGVDEKDPKIETFPPNPQSPYALTKLCGEIYCRIFSRLYALETVSLRYFNVFGPRQDPQSIYAAVIPRFIAAIRQNEPPVIYGDGEQSRDFTYIANVVEANLLAMEKPGISGQVFNVAAGQRTTLKELLSALEEVAGKTVVPRFDPPRAGDIRHSLAAIDLAQTYLGYRLQIDLKEGLATTWQWFQKKEKKE